MIATLLVLAAVGAPTVAVLPIYRGVHEVDVPVLHEAIARRVHEKFLVNVAPYNQLLVHDPTIGVRAIRGCKADTTCIARIAARHDVDLIVIVTQYPTDDRPVIVANAIDRRGRVRGEQVQTDAPDDATPMFVRITESILDGAAVKRGGQVVVKPDPIDAATTFVPPPFRTLGPHTYLFEPGVHQYRSTAADHQAQEGTIEVMLSGHHDLAVTLSKAETPVVESPVFWAVAVGAAAAAVVATVVVAKLAGDSRSCFHTSAVPCP